MSATALSPEHQKILEALRSSGIKPPQAVLDAHRVSQLKVCEFGERYFYIPDTQKPIVLEEFQKILLRIITGEYQESHLDTNLLDFYTTILWSSIKKTGKTAISGLHARWRAESTTPMDEILFFANDETQSRGRAYAAVEVSIKLDPNYDQQKRVLLDREGNVRWRVIEDYLEHIPTATKVRAVNVDYRGEAGANPSNSYWTEAWAFDTPKQEALYDEMTPVPTRERSQRYVESYAGVIGKSKVLEKLWKLASEHGRRLTLEDVPEWPWPEECVTKGGTGLPLYVNDQAGVFAYIDQGEAPRKRHWWLMGDRGEKYYREQAITLTDPQQFERLHRNQWITATTAFIQIEWWHQCQDNSIPELTPFREPLDIREVPHVDDPDYDTKFKEYINLANWQQMSTKSDPICLAIDASVSGDCTAINGVSRHPQRYNDCALRIAYKWDPPRGGKIDYERTPNSITGLSLWQTVIDLIVRYNVVELPYDEFQMHHLINQLRALGLVWCRSFSQSSERDIADKQLFDLIKLRRIGYNPNSSKIDHKAMETHLQNAAKQQRAREDTKMHIVKSADDAKIDLTIGLSMAAAECLRLDM